MTNIALLDTVNHTPIIDTHEHLRRDGDWAPEAMNLETICRGYLSWIVPEAAAAPDMSLEAWWARLAPILPSHRGLAFYRSLLIAFRDLYGLAEDGIDGTNWRALSERIRDAYRDPGWRQWVLRERAGIDRILHDRYWQFGAGPADASYLLPVFRLDAAFSGYNRQALDHDGNSPYGWLDAQGMAVDTLDDYLRAIEHAVRRAAAGGAPCMKIAVAYSRDLAFCRPNMRLAQEAFGRTDDELAPAAVRAFQDSVLYTALEAARQHGLPVQVHTGLAQITGSNPVNFAPVIADFPDIRFVLFHGGYPWTGEVGALAFTYQNVSLDLVWLPIISPAVARRALHEWLDLGMGPRICWGGDCWTAEEAYGSAALGRRTITQVLSEKMEEGAFGLDHACHLARRILRENALELYRLS